MSNKSDSKPIDLKAMSKWRSISPDMRAKLLDNVFCHECKLTTIVDYSVEEDDYGLILKGKCKKCGGPVARVIEGFSDNK